MYQAIIARIKTRPHPNADRIQLADVCGTTVVVGLDHQDNDLGVYFPTDGVLSHDFCVANNLYNKNARAKLGLPDGPIGFFDHHRRVRAQGFRGQKSDGFWLPMNCLDFVQLTYKNSPIYTDDILTEGYMFDTIDGNLICSKWTTYKPQSGSVGARKGRKGELQGFPKHQDTEQWDYYKDQIPDGSLITITEKLHGTSHRLALVRQDPVWWKFWAKPQWQRVDGSRNVVLTDHSGRNSFYDSDEFRNRACHTVGRKGEVLYGEIVGFTDPGKPVMNGGEIPQEFLVERQQYGEHMHYRYGQSDGHCEFFLYRVVQFNEDGEGVELSHSQVVRRAQQLGYRVPPLMFVGHLSDYDRNNIDYIVKSFTGDPSLPSLLDSSMIREGVVVRVDTPDGHTKFYKKKSFLFKVLEGIVKLDETYEDVEENA